MPEAGSWPTLGTWPKLRMSNWQDDFHRPWLYRWCSKLEEHLKNLNTWVQTALVRWSHLLISSPEMKPITCRCNAAPRPAILPSRSAFTLLGYNCLCIKTELQYVSHSFITYSCGLDGKLIKGCCCLLRAFSNCWKAISLHLLPTFKMAIVLVSALHEGCGSEQNSKLPKNVQSKSTKKEQCTVKLLKFFERIINFFVDPLSLWDPWTLTAIS